MTEEQDPRQIRAEDLYRGKLETVLKAAQDEYKQITYDRRAMQQGILKNYMWLSTVIASVQAAILLKVKAGELAFVPLHPTPLFLFFILSAIALSCGTFVFAADTLRGRGAIAGPYSKSFTKIARLTYEICSGTGTRTDGTPAQDPDWYYMQIKDLQISILANAKIAEEVGRKLRCMSWLFLCSLASTILALIVAAF